jgi:hypothetical protein
MCSTASVIVFSAAKAEEEAMRPSPKAAVESNLIMGFLSLRSLAAAAGNEDRHQDGADPNHAI